MIKKIIYTLFIILLVLTVLSGFTLAFIYTEKSSFFLILSSVLSAAALLFFLIRAVFIKYKVRQFINRLLNQDKSKKNTSDNNANFIALLKKWEQVLEKLRSSSLSRFGNPIYALPWYLILGESGSGKSSLVKYSGLLPSPDENILALNHLSLKENCDWWFLNETVLLDSSGRYTRPLDPATDSVNWTGFLDTLSKVRKHEPINGIICVISADKLQNAKPNELSEYGALIRNRIDEVMRTQCASVPIYIMISKMDMLLGMPEFFRTIPKSQLTQAMGWSNKQNKEYCDDLLNDAMGNITERLKYIQLKLLHSKNSPEAEVIVFPKRFSELIIGLRMFCTPIFSKSIYTLSPLFRGLYFSSASQRIGQSISDENNVSLSEQAQSGGLFLNEFFSKILPADRYLHFPIREYIKKRFIRLNTLFAGWTVFWLLLFFLFLSGYNHTKSLFLSHKMPSMSGNADYVLVTDSLLSLHILFGKANKSLIPFRTGYKQANLAEDSLCYLFTSLFSSYVNTPLFLYIDSTVRKTTDRASEDHILHLINFLSSLLQIAKTDINDQVQGNFVSNASLFISDTQAHFRSDELPLIANQYRAWSKLSSTENRSSFDNKLYYYLALLINNKGSDLKWCCNYPIHAIDTIRPSLFWSSCNTEQRATVTPIGEREFVFDNPSPDAFVLTQINKSTQCQIDSIQDNWLRIRLPSGKMGWIDSASVSVLPATPLYINGAFTLEGSRRISSFLSHIDSSMYDKKFKNQFNANKNLFLNWYYDQYGQVWDSFLAKYSAAILKSIFENSSQREFFVVLKENEDPFLLFIKKVSSEIDSIAYRPSFDWADQVTFLSAVHSYTSNPTNKDSTITKAAKKTPFFNILKKAENVKSLLNSKQKAFQMKVEQNSNYWSNYRSVLSAISATVIQPDGMIRFSRALFDAQDTLSKPFFSANDAYEVLKNKAFEGKTDASVDSLLSAPLSIVKVSAYMAAHKELQRLWSSEVFSKIRSVNQDDQAEKLFSPDSGYIVKFLNNPYVTSFIQRNQEGTLVPVNGPNGPVSFSEVFLELINKGIHFTFKREYLFEIQTVPYTVNPGAIEEPYETILRLQCSDKSGVLENYNNNETAEFLYRPANCGNVTLKVIFQSFIATKTWPGKWGLPYFLKSLRDGTCLLNAEDFDTECQYNLKKKNIKWIKITYLIDHQSLSDITSIVQDMPYIVPETIIKPGIYFQKE